MHPSFQNSEILKKMPEFHCPRNGAWVMYLKIKEFYQKTGEWGPPWLSLLGAVSTDGVSLILLPGLEIALHQIDG